MKLLMPERGTADVAEMWLAADRCVSSLLLYPESRAAVARAGRMGRLARDQLEIAVRRVDALWQAVDKIDVSARLAQRAGERAEAHGLRTYDAVHLASFEEVGDVEAVLVSADVALLEAARSLGYATALPRE